MTDNTPVVPTDAEIEALGHRMCWRYKHDTGVNHISTFTFHAQTLHDFARAVLAKWGAQQAPDPRQVIEMCKKALAEELAAWDIDPPLHHVLEAHDACAAWLAAAPQPVAREPLTDEHLRVIERMHVYAHTATLMDFARAIERAHGITTNGRKDAP